MAYHIKADGTITEVQPQNGTDFKLKELQQFVGGRIELVRTTDDRLMVINEEGKLLGLPLNKKATWLYIHRQHDSIMGDVLVCESHEVK